MEEPPTPPGTSPDPEPSVADAVQYVREAMEPTAAEGDRWCVVPWDYINRIVTALDDNGGEPADSRPEVASWTAFRAAIGPIDSHQVLDPTTQQLYPPASEPVATYAVPPHLYAQLVTWFGTTDTAPVERFLVSNVVDGQARIEIERTPPVFHIHQVTAGAPKRYYHHHQAPQVVQLTSTATFAALAAEIARTTGSDPANFRMWFIPASRGEDKGKRIPSQISVSQLVHQYSPSLVQPAMYQTQLRTIAGIGHTQTYFHVVVDPLANGKYVVDTWVDATPVPTLESVLHTGGVHGLSNLGNTCYMNSALQCLLHVPEMCRYFLFDAYLRELNPSNPLGYHGQVAEAFGSLLKQTYDVTTSSAIAPREFKSTIGRFSSMFSGYMQQDSQELLSWLLDALHEDLNRILDKPYSEKPELDDGANASPAAIVDLANRCWAQYKSRNDSVITDLFTGLYQSTLVCPVCNHTSITFDPYNDITLPLPVAKKWYHTFTVVDLSAEGIYDRAATDTPRVFQLEVELKKTANLDDLRAYVARTLDVAASDLFLYEIWQHSVYKDFQQDDRGARFMPVSDMITSGQDDVYIYYLPHAADDVIVPVFHSVHDPEFSGSGDATAVPVFAVVPPDERDSLESVTARVMAASSVLSPTGLAPKPEGMEVESGPEYTVKYTLQSRTSKVKGQIADNRTIMVPVRRQYHPEFRPLAEYLAPGAQESPSDDYVVVSSPQSPSDTPQQPSDDDSSDGRLGLSDDEPSVPRLESELDTPGLVTPADKSPVPSPAPALARHMALLVEWRRDAWDAAFGDTTLHDAPKRANPELDASKKLYERQRTARVTLGDCLTQFSTPEVLGEHDLWYCPKCKEHQQATKAIQLWQCGEIVTIHLKRFHSARAFADKIEMVVDFPIEGLDLSSYVAGPGDDHIYDLIGVDNHYGGLGGGHYTAAAKNNRDGKWYYYNDARVTPLDSPEEVITGAAYLLFYHKRSPVKGSQHIQQLLTTGEQEFSASLQENNRSLSQVVAQCHEFAAQQPRVPQFTVEEDPDLYEEENGGDDGGDDGRARKQRVLSKDPTSNKVAHINSSGDERIAHSPKPDDSE
ncbi:ubiquitin carboxyl-terminal hydrolase 12 [Diutina catenulata]